MFDVVKNLTATILIVLCSKFSFAQDTGIATVAPSFTKIPLPPKPDKTHIYIASTASVAGYTGSLVALSNAWYKNYPQSSFHFFNDNDDWLQVDKAGHVFSAYTAGKMSMELWRWAGLSRKQRIWIGGISGTAFLTVVEVLDGFSSGWGFSMGDLGADLAGSSLLIAQELTWNEQRIQIKFSFHRNNYNDPVLNTRANDLFGSRSLERMLKDYNGQTYWVSANLKSFFKTLQLPSWLNIAVGYGADGMFGGTENIVKDKSGITVFDRSDLPRYRQWYLAPDIDLTKIKTKSKFLKTTF
ncbi:MAG: DUF2279 domain-containing protein, partial [Sediminibacterium sp.]